MKLGPYDPRPNWFNKMLHRVAVFWAIVIGFPVIVYVFDKVAVYILGFALVVAAYWVSIQGWGVTCGLWVEGGSGA